MVKPKEQNIGGPLLSTQDSCFLPTRTLGSTTMSPTLGGWPQRVATALWQVPMDLWLHEGMFHDWVMHLGEASSGRCFEHITTIYILICYISISDKN